VGSTQKAQTLRYERERLVTAAEAETRPQLWSVSVKVAATAVQREKSKSRRISWAKFGSLEEVVRCRSKMRGVGEATQGVWSAQKARLLRISTRIGRK
jgi:hypothetical protein